MDKVKLPQGISLEELGNVLPKYQNPRRWAQPEGFVIVDNPQLILKFYQMIRASGDRLDSMRIGGAKRFVEDKTQRGEIDPLLGMGFAILSEDMLNVIRWDTQYPIVGRNDVYEYQYNPNNFRFTAKRLDIREAGAFCLWEDRIKLHEGRAWERYLNSAKGNGAKRKYLCDFLPDCSLDRV